MKRFCIFSSKENYKQPVLTAVHLYSPVYKLPEQNLLCCLENLVVEVYLTEMDTEICADLLIAFQQTASEVVACEYYPYHI